MKPTFYLFPLLLTLCFASGHSQPVWTQKADYAGNPRFDFAGFSLNGFGYFGGGRYASPLNALSEWQEFNPSANTWQLISPMPLPFTGLSAFECAGNGYVVNGANDVTYNWDTYLYNQPGNVWSTGVPFTFPRLFAASTGDGAKGFVIGGYEGAANPMCDLWEYDPVLEAWTEKTPLPVTASRFNATAFAVNGGIFVFGGSDGKAPLNDLWRYDTATNLWSQKTSIPGVERERSISFVIGSEAYIIGGVPSGTPTLKEVWKYHAATDTWTQLPDFPGTNAPIGGVGFEINGKGYIVCGNGTSECWEFDPGEVGIADIMPSSRFRVYPNPSDGIFNIGLTPEGSEKINGIEIFNSQGLHVFMSSFSETKIDLSSQPNGLYFIRAETSGGTMTNRLILLH
jgi:N-acetylneuraminic acid mutarotase